MSEQPMLPGMPDDPPHQTPVPRPQTTGLSTAARIWLAVGGLVVVIGFIAAVAAAHSTSAPTDCRGGPDRMAIEQITYQSDDDVHWTATYPCLNGGSTTRPIAKTAVPGAGG